MNDLEVLVAYSCPGCGLGLEMFTDDWRDWARCPSCDYPTRPPRAGRGAAANEEITFLDAPEPDAPWSPNSQFSSANPQARASAWGIAVRSILGVGLFVSVSGVLLALFHKDPSHVAIHGFLVLILLAWLAAITRVS